MKTLSIPLTTSADSVIDSEYNEQTPHICRKKKQHRKRSKHKHVYADAWVEQWVCQYLGGGYEMKINPIGYCVHCGRVDTVSCLKKDFNSGYKTYRELCDKGPQPGDKVFRTQKPAAGSGYVFIDDVNLNDYYLKE